MTSINLNKKQLIDIITVHYLKQGKIIDTNLKKIAKHKLKELIQFEQIPIVPDEQLKLEITETENYTSNLEIIYYNFLRFKSIPVSIITDIKNNPNLTSNDLLLIINKYNMITDDIHKIRKFNKMILSITSIYNDYIIDSNSKTTLEFKTLPDLIISLSSLNNLQ